MLTVDRDVFERAVLQLLASQEIEQLVTEFSLNRVFFYSLLNDVSMGKDSSNYQVLNDIALGRDIDVQLIVERANSIISYLTQDDQEEDYAERFPALQIVVSRRFMGVISGNFVYLSLVIIVILVLTFYILQSGMFFGGVGKGEFSQETEETKLPPESQAVLEEEQEQNLTMGKRPFSDNETGKDQKSLSKEEAKTSEVVGSQNKKTILSEEVAKLTREKITIRSSAKEGANVTTVNEGKGAISNSAKTSKEVPRGIKYLVEEGDTLWGIATRYKTSVYHIKTMNNLTSNSLKTGKVLIVPSSPKSVRNQAVEQGHTEQKSKEKNNVEEIQPSKEREKALTISSDSDIKTIETKLQGNVQEEIHKEERIPVHAREEALKEANIPKTTTSFEPDTIKDIRSRLWNSDRNILGPE